MRSGIRQLKERVKVMEEFKKLPRQGMREDAFRKYETLIGRACCGSVVVDPSEMRLLPSSFISAFNEARRGYRHFRYPSKWIPITADVMHIRVFELEGGKVLLENKFADTQAKKMQAEFVPLEGVPGATAHAVPEENLPIKTLLFEWGSDTTDRFLDRMANELPWRKQHNMMIRCKTPEGFLAAKAAIKAKGLEFIESSKEAYVVYAS